jgi:vancomycin resistance protein YoaR
MGIIAAVCAVVFLFLLALLIDSTLYAGKVHAGVAVSGLQLGGLTPAEAKSALELRVEQAQKSPITLTSADKSWTISPAELGTKVDVAATVAAAMDVSRRSSFFVDRLHGFAMYFRDSQVPLVATVDEAKMDSALAKVYAALDLPPINAGLVFEGQKIRVVKGQKGRVVDRPALAEQLKAVLVTLHTTEVPVPMTVKDPAVLADNYDQALQQAVTMTDSAVKLVGGDRTWTLSPSDIIAYMDFSAKDEGGVSILVSYLSASKMGPFLQEVAAAVVKEPVDAVFKSDGSKAWVVPAVNGRKLDPEKTLQALNEAALSRDDRTAKCGYLVREPKLTTKKAEAMGIKDKLADYATKWVGTPDRQTNVRITTEYASNVILAPGEVYDFNKQVGPRTPERGYKLAPGIVGPGKLEDVFGGGICQVSTTLFNAAFEAGLEILERRNHSIFINHYPLGRDATVSTGTPNLRFRNDTAKYILIRGASDGINTKFVIYGTDDGRTVESTTSAFYDVVEQTVKSTTNKSLGTGTSVVIEQGQPGRRIKVIRVVKAADGTIIHKNTFISSWEMFPKKIEVGAAKPTTTTTKATTTTTTKATTTTTVAPTTTTASTG